MVSARFSASVGNGARFFFDNTEIIVKFRLARFLQC